MYHPHSPQTRRLDLVLGWMGHRACGQSPALAINRSRDPYIYTSHTNTTTLDKSCCWIIIQFHLNRYWQHSTYPTVYWQRLLRFSTGLIRLRIVGSWTWCESLMFVKSRGSVSHCWSTLRTYFPYELFWVCGTTDGWVTDCLLWHGLCTCGYHIALVQELL